jgi:aryl-alcohol dehydrogenase-like predicted oxidoreductase
MKRPLPSMKRLRIAEAHAMLDAFVDAGHDFVDTADLYGDGAAERTLKPWLARRRDDVVVTTKVRFPVTDPGGEDLAPERIHAACEARLRRLGIDTIDLYESMPPTPVCRSRRSLRRSTIWCVQA